jgi:transcriptional regulator with XRE-family HTH domain
MAASAAPRLVAEVSLGEAVLLARRRRSWSLRDLRAASGVSNSTICRVENGYDATWSTVVAIARALDLSLDDLAAGTAERGGTTND